MKQNLNFLCCFILVNTILICASEKKGIRPPTVLLKINSASLTIHPSPKIPLGNKIAYRLESSDESKEESIIELDDESLSFSKNQPLLDIQNWKNKSKETLYHILGK